MNILLDNKKIVEAETITVETERGIFTIKAKDGGLALGGVFQDVDGKSHAETIQVGFPVESEVP